VGGGCGECRTNSLDVRPQQREGVGEDKKKPQAIQIPVRKDRGPGWGLAGEQGVRRRFKTKDQRELGSKKPVEAP